MRSASSRKYSSASIEATREWPPWLERGCDKQLPCQPGKCRQQFYGTGRWVATQPESFVLTKADTLLISKRRAPDSVPQSGGAGRGAGPCRVLLQLPESFDLTNVDTFPMSARPASLPFNAPMTLPVSEGAFAPVAAIASATAASISASDIACGM